MEQLVWSDHRPWIPRPLLSMHVRMGDKACEMNPFGLEKYMELATQIREHFPDLKNIWLSTEMQAHSTCIIFLFTIFSLSSFILLIGI
jgi:hypothetical protein